MGLCPSKGPFPRPCRSGVGKIAEARGRLGGPCWLVGVGSFETGRIWRPKKVDDSHFPPLVFCLEGFPPGPLLLPTRQPRLVDARLLQGFDTSCTSSMLIASSDGCGHTKPDPFETSRRPDCLRLRRACFNNGDRGPHQRSKGYGEVSLVRLERPHAGSRHPAARL